MSWLGGILRASGGPQALPTFIDQSRIVLRMAFPAWLAISLGSLAAPARGEDEAAPLTASVNDALTSDAVAGEIAGNGEIAANLPDDDEAPREARRDDARGDSGDPREGDRRGGPGFGGPRGGRFRGGPGFGGAPWGPRREWPGSDDFRRGPRPEWDSRPGDHAPPFAGGRGWAHGPRPGWHHGPPHHGPHEFASRDHHWHRRPFGGGRESREIIWLLHELRDEVARLNREIEQLRAERGPGGFRGPFWGPGMRGRMQGERREGPGRDAVPPGRGGPDTPRFDRRGPGGPPPDGRERERRRPEGGSSGGTGASRDPDGRGPEERPQRTELQRQPPRGDDAIVETVPAQEE